MELKVCMSCGKEKPIDEFYSHSQMKDGHLNKCKECTKRDVKTYRETNPNAQLTTRIKACEKNPTQDNAHKALNTALKAGKIIKPDRCQSCGRNDSESRLCAHHYDYSRPLDVIWLCSVCHRHSDKMRRVVESGQTVKEYRREKNRRDSFTNRAIKYYKENVNTRLDL